jgi:lysophospholipase L1-like esterase
MMSAVAFLFVKVRRVLTRTGSTGLVGLMMGCAVGCPVALGAGAPDGCARANGPPASLSDPAADWAGLCAYREGNRVLLARGRPVRAVFMGDSITFLWGQDNPGLFSGEYADRGIIGQTTQQTLLRFRQDVIELRPVSVQILAGTNDLLRLGGAVTVRDMAGDIRSMVELAAENHIAVVLATVPPWGRGVGTEQKRTALLAFNAWLRSFARARKLKLADYFAVLVDRSGNFNPALTIDGVHPNRQGFALMEPLAGYALAGILDR